MTLTPDHRIGPLAARQDGAFHLRQAAKAGFTRHQRAHRVATGQWLHPYPDVFVLAGVPPSPRQRLRIAVMASGGAAAHRSSCWMIGLTDHPPPKPEITVPSNRHFRSDDVVVHRQQDLTPDDLCVVAGIPCTNAYETLLSVGVTVPLIALEKMLDRALRQGLVDYDGLVSHYLRKARQGRDGGGKLRELLELRDPEMPAAASELETELYDVIRKSRLPMPERQFPLTLPDGRDVFFDLAYPSVKVCLEGDGFGIHTLRGMFETDRSRGNAVVLAGWWPLHFTWRMIRHEHRYIIATVDQALRQRGYFGDLSA